LEEKIDSNPKSLIGNKGYSRFLKINRGSIRIDKNKLKRKRFNGKWVLQTKFFQNQLKYYMVCICEMIAQKKNHEAIELLKNIFNPTQIPQLEFVNLK
jgi:hypothetical protein